MEKGKGNKFDKNYFYVEGVDHFDKKYLRNILNLEGEPYEYIEWTCGNIK